MDARGRHEQTPPGLSGTNEIKKLLAGFVPAVALFVIAVHVILPPVLLRRVNHRLQTIPGYDGHVESLRLGWLTPSLTVARFKLVKRNQTAPGAAVSAEKVKVRFFWTALLRGRFILTMTLEKPTMLFLMRERRAGQPRPSGVWRTPFERFPPFRVDQIALHNGIFRFKNDDALPPIDVSFNDADLRATSLTNRAELAESRTVTVEGRALMQDHALLRFSLQIKPFREHAEFDIKGTLNDFNLTVMNSIMRYYTGMEMEKGRLSMRLDLAVRNGAFNGRVERTIDDLTIKKNSRGLMKMVKENMAQAWLDWHEEAKTGRLKKEFSYAGPMGYLDKDTVLAAVWVAKGAFIQALKPNLKDEVRPVTPEEALDKWAEFQAKQRKKAGRTD